jgi:hypothetical protein
MVFEIEGNPEWRANGMREIFCMCGEGHVSARYSKTKNGQQKTAVEGACKNCGPIRITADDWLVAKVPSDSTLSGRFVRIDPGDEHERNEADCQFGNPLTHGDKRAELLGKQRRAQGEGHFGTMTVGYNLFEEDNRHVRLDQARIEVYLTYCLVHALSMEVRRQRAAGAAKPQLLKVRRGPPPGPRPRAIAA